MVIEELVKTVLNGLRETVQIETVVGKPIVLTDATVVPISRVSIGFGVGGGQVNKKGQGGEVTGGGMTIEPVAFIVVRKEKVELISIRKDDFGMSRIVELIPEIADKIKDLTRKKVTDSDDLKNRMTGESHGTQKKHASGRSVRSAKIG
jgi:uncharacterized spore protein YtfJ